MPPKCRSKAKSTKSSTKTVGTRGIAQSAARPAPPLQAVQSECRQVAQHDGPITRSRTARSRIKPDIHALPLEILSTIFILALASDEELVAGGRIFDSRPMFRTPLPLCTVSSRWRSIALATPQLWQRVFVLDPQCISRATAMSKVVPWIERSGSLPLTLFIWLRHCIMDERDSIVNVLHRYASRWETLYIAPLRPFARLIQNPLQLIHVDKWSSLQRIYAHFEPHANTPWAQLTHLEFCCSLSYAQVVDIFKGCRRLVWLSLSNNLAPTVFFDAPVSPIILPDLSFVSFTTSNLSAIIQLISLPSLRELSIHKTYGQACPKSLLHFLTRSACTLDKLIIKELLPSADDLVQILDHRSCNLLTSLTISQSSSDVPNNALINDEVLWRLRLHHGNSACTHLKYLCLKSNYRAALISESVLAKMVESRIGSRSGQLQDGLLHILHLKIRLDCGRTLDEIIKRSKMEVYESGNEYSRYFVHLHRRGSSHAPPASNFCET
jgi:hypothetical protein